MPTRWRKVGTRYDGCFTSSASLFTLMRPSLWNRVNLDLSDHMTFFHCSRVKSSCSRSNWSLFFRLASLISGFLQAPQISSPNPLSSLSIVCGNALTFTINYSCSTVVFFYDLISPNVYRRSRSFKIFILTFLPWRWWFPTIFLVFSNVLHSS